MSLAHLDLQQHAGNAIRGKRAGNAARRCRPRAPAPASATAAGRAQGSAGRQHDRSETPVPWHPGWTLLPGLQYIFDTQLYSNTCVHM